jgi:hypothetical protein
MKKVILVLTVVVATACSTGAQNKTVLLDISHEQKEQYTGVNPQIFEQ